MSPEQTKLSIAPAGSHGAASSRSGELESSGRRRGQAPKQPIHKNRTSSGTVAESVPEQGSALHPSEASELVELKALFRRRSYRKAYVEPGEAIAAKDQPRPPVKQLRRPFLHWWPRLAEVERQEVPREGVALNADVHRLLTALDDQLVDALRKGDIALVRSSWLLAQPENYRIERRQDLQMRQDSPLLSPEEAVALIRKGDRSVGVLSYGCELCHSLFGPTFNPFSQLSCQVVC